MHVTFATDPTIRLTESGDPTGAVVSATPTAFGTLIRVLKKDTPP